MISNIIIIVKWCYNIIIILLFYHEDLFSSVSTPPGFDNQKVRKLEYSAKLAYLRSNIPDELVIELQNAIGKSLIEPRIISAPGFLGKYKLDGTLDVDLETGLVSFTEAVTNKHKTIIKMSPDEIQDLRKNDFHLFPNT